MKRIYQRASSPDRLKPGDSWRANTTTSSSARGYGYKWQRARADYLLSHPLCVMCKAQGIVTAARVVDHIKPHEGDMRLFWQRSNWQALCTPCHSSRKQALEWQLRNGR